MERTKKEARNFSLFGILLAIFIFFAPLESFFLSSSGSLLKFYALGFIALLLFKLMVKDIRLRLDGTGMSILLFVVIIAASTLWSPHMSRGFNVLFAIGLQCLIIIVAAQIDYTDKEKTTFLLCYIASCIILSLMVYSNRDMLEAGLRASASVSEKAVVDPNNIAGLIVGGIAILLNIEAKNRLFAFLKMAVGAMFAVALFMTASRGAFLAMIVILVYSLFNEKGMKNRIRIIAIILLIAMLVTVAGGLLFGGNNPINFIFQRFEEDQTGSGRTGLWSDALKAIWDSPIFGYGLGESVYVIGEARTRNIGTHNTYLTIWMEGGIIAITAFLSIYVSLWKKRGKDFYSKSVFGVLASSMVVSFFIDTYNKKILWLPILLCIIANTEKRKVKDDKYNLNKEGI